MFFGKKKRRRRSSNDSSMVNWIIVVVVGLAILHNLQKNPSGSPENIATSIHKTVEEITAKKELNFGDYKSKVFPTQIATFHVEDITMGDGSPAICGQKVSIAYNTSTEDDKPLNDKAGKDDPLTFTVGEHKVMPSLEEGVIGMKKGGTRKIFSPANMSYGIKEYAKADVPPDANVSFGVELLEATPDLPDPKDTIYRIATVRGGNGHIIGCGDTVKMQLTVWSVEGKKLFSTYDEGHTPLTFTTGKSETIMGWNRASSAWNKAAYARSSSLPPCRNHWEVTTQALRFPCRTTKQYLSISNLCRTRPMKDER
jgi:peptidylprolyl isomerase